MTSLNILKSPWPNVKSAVENIEKYMDGMRQTYLLFHAFDLNLFEHTVSEIDTNTLSKELGADDVMLQMFCEALASIGFLNKTKNGFVNSLETTTYFVQSSPYCLISSYNGMRREIEGWHSLQTLLKNGPKMLNRTQIFNEEWMQGIAASAKSGNVQNVVLDVSDVIDLHSVKRMMDIGGGHGLYSIAFSALNPDMEIWIMDLPDILPVAKKNIFLYNATNVHLIPGDFTKDDIGSNYDLIFSSFNPSGSNISMIPILKHALSPDGFLVIRQFKEEIKDDAVKNLGWNLYRFDDSNYPRRRFSGPDTVSIDQYNSELISSGFEMIRRWDFDEVSEITVMRLLGDR
ncbi:MAG: hypothetical protein GX369_04435 [Euryarchaeota archaeon]|nr:hypothetical protein [Euryarchaeota archaeon]